MDTPWAVIPPMVSPFYIFLLRRSWWVCLNGLLEAGMIDGAGPVRGFAHVIFAGMQAHSGCGGGAVLCGLLDMVEQPLGVSGEQHGPAAPRP